MEQTGQCPRGGDGGDWIKKVKEVAKEQICITHGHGQ